MDKQFVMEAFSNSAEVKRQVCPRIFSENLRGRATALFARFMMVAKFCCLAMGGARPMPHILRLSLSDGIDAIERRCLPLRLGHRYGGLNLYCE